MSVNYNSDGKGGENPHLGKQACQNETWQRPACHGRALCSLVLCVLISRIFYNLDQNGLLTIYQTFGRYIFVTGIWMKMDTSYQGIPHIVIYPTILHNPIFQLNPLAQNKFLSNQNQMPQSGIT